MPSWPKIHLLDQWKTQLVMAVVSASGDPDVDRGWKLNPDLLALSNSGNKRFTMIDIKLALALNGMVKAAGDVARRAHGYQQTLGGPSS